MVDEGLEEVGIDDEGIDDEGIDVGDTVSALQTSKQNEANKMIRNTLINIVMLGNVRDGNFDTFFCVRFLCN